MEFKLVDTVELDYDFYFYNMKNRITYLNHGQYIIFEKLNLAIQAEVERSGNGKEFISEILL